MTITLKVKLPKQDDLTVEVADDATVKDLKEEIAKKCSTPVDRQRVIFSGKVLKDTFSLSQYSACLPSLSSKPRPNLSLPPTKRNATQQTSRTATPCTWSPLRLPLRHPQELHLSPHPPRPLGRIQVRTKRPQEDRKSVG